MNRQITAVRLSLFRLQRQLVSWVRYLTNEVDFEVSSPVIAEGADTASIPSSAWVRVDERLARRIEGVWKFARRNQLNSVEVPFNGVEWNDADGRPARQLTDLAIRVNATGDYCFVGAAGSDGTRFRTAYDSIGFFDFIKGINPATAPARAANDGFRKFY